VRPLLLQSSVFDASICGEGANRVREVVSEGVQIRFLISPSIGGVTLSFSDSILMLDLVTVESFGGAIHGVQAICRAGI
jgi:hypothetical protein